MRKIENHQRTNPTQIKKFVKTWLTEAINEAYPEKAAAIINDVHKAIEDGTQEAFKEIAKKRPQLLDML